MKIKCNNIFLSVVVIVALGGCKERMIMPLTPSGERVVLIEEFTGKGCTNCPKGSKELENLLSIYGEQLVVVSIHANFFADPQFFPLGQYDFRTEEGEQLFDFLGPNFGYPAGVVDRRKLNGDFQLGLNVWAGLVAQDAAIPPRVEFSLTREYDPSSRHFHLQVNGRAKEDILGPLNISVMITESGIVDAQDVKEEGGIVDDYVHNHVLRDMLTPYNGKLLSDGLGAAQEFTEEFDTDLSDLWVAENCNVIVFISLAGSGDISVLQAGEVHVTE